MIVVADGWKRCSRCRLFLPAVEAFSSRRTRKGTPAFDSYCRVCRRDLARARRSNPVFRERDKARARAAYHRRRQDPLWVAVERNRKAALARQTRALDPERTAETQRFAYWKAREDAGHPLVRTRALEHGPRLHYRPPSKADVVPAEPLLRYLRHAFHGWKPGEITSAHGGVIGRRLLEAFNGRQDMLDLDAVDRFLTIGMGRPDLLNELYPLESR